MPKQLEDRRIEKLEYRLDQAHRVIRELLGALTCPSEELRMLVHDVAKEYMEEVYDRMGRDGTLPASRNGGEGVVDDGRTEVPVL